MNKLKHAGIYALGLAVLVALIPVSTHAETDAKIAITEARCNLAETKLTTKINDISALQTARAAKYTAITNRVDTFITNATNAKYPSVDKLTNARQTVTDAITTYNSQVATYQTALTNAKTVTCGDNGGKFVSAITQARTELVKVRTDSLAIKTAVEQNAVPALRDYAAWLKTSTSTTEGNK